MVNILRTQLELPELEAEFRADGLASDKRVAAGLVVVAIGFLIVITVASTLVYRNNTQLFHVVWAIRAVDLAVAAVALILVRRADSPRAYDTVVTWWIGMWFAGVVIENAFLPAGATGFVTWDVFLAVAVYVAVSLPLPRQAALAALLTGGDLVVLWKFKSPDPSFEAVEVVLAFACANVVGVLVSRELHGWRRRAFLALRHEVVTRKALESALNEVKTLQGLIPICMYCKQIQTDAGDWQQVEAYVRAHSDAEFSHGMCPACLKAHFPEFAQDQGAGRAP